MDGVMAAVDEVGSSWQENSMIFQLIQDQSHWQIRLA